MSAPFTDHGAAARAILSKALAGDASLRGREGQFLGGLAFDPAPISEKQANWLGILLARHGLPALAGGDA